jgi:nucleoside-diphosphate-sugar epimerase
MNILIIGGGGFIGRRLARALAARGTLRGEVVAGLTLADLTAPETVDAPFPVDCVACDIGDPGSVAAAIGPDVHVIFLLAAIVSGHAEADFDIGMRVNLMGTLNVLDRCRALGTAPVVVFTSSCAVFGGEVPDPIRDWTIPNPQTSYGTQKAMGELALNDYSRRGFVRGRGFRLPTISVRPGAPNRAASSFMSGIIREPLNGQRATCPVAEDFPHYYLSPRAVTDNLILGAEMDQADLGPQVNMTMPGQSWTVRQLIDAMTAVAGPGPATLIDWEPQPEVERIVAGWRFDYDAQKARDLGLHADDSFEDNVRYYIEEEGISL